MKLLALLPVVALPGARLLTADWTQFRGPGGDGVAATGKPPITSLASSV